MNIDSIKDDLLLYSSCEETINNVFNSLWSEANSYIDASVKYDKCMLECTDLFFIQVKIEEKYKLIFDELEINYINLDIDDFTKYLSFFIKLYTNIS